jgi:hypothetical protein
MDWAAAAALGMVGGGIVEAVAFWGNLAAWQQARHVARRRGRRLPPVTRYVDPAADALAAVTRLVLGAAAALILHTQISGVVTAIAVGASAPALLAQLGAARALSAAELAGPGQRGSQAHSSPQAEPAGPGLRGSQAHSSPQAEGEGP